MPPVPVMSLSKKYSRFFSGNIQNFLPVDFAVSAQRAGFVQYADAEYGIYAFIAGIVGSGNNAAFELGPAHPVETRFDAGGGGGYHGSGIGRTAGQDAFAVLLDTMGFVYGNAVVFGKAASVAVDIAVFHSGGNQPVAFDNFGVFRAVHIKHGVNTRIGLPAVARSLND